MKEGKTYLFLEQKGHGLCARFNSEGQNLLDLSKKGTAYAQGFYLELKLLNNPLKYGFHAEGQKLNNLLVKGHTLFA